MELKDTINLMLSKDYKERFKAEYLQTMIRYAKLRNMISKYGTGAPDFVPNCPLNILKQQAMAMSYYLRSLEIRAEIEKIEL